MNGILAMRGEGYPIKRMVRVIAEVEEDTLVYASCSGNSGMFVISLILCTIRKRVREAYFLIARPSHQLAEWPPFRRRPEEGANGR